MVRERYPGERVGLRLFLDGLRPVVEAELGRDTLLFYAIRRALRSGRLDELRRARQMFNMLPRDTKRLLSAAIVASSARARSGAVQSTGASDPVVVFTGGDRLRASLDVKTPITACDDTGATETAPVQVLVEPGTLPSVAAGTLRRIADLIERDRRLLSHHFWSEQAVEDG